MDLVGFIGLVRLVGLVSLGGMVGRLGSRSVGLVALVGFRGRLGSNSADSVWRLRVCVWRELVGVARCASHLVRMIYMVRKRWVSNAN